ncbi:MAG: hypothetical protein AB7I19_14030 [Planctomycetota bacterium]
MIEGGIPEAVDRLAMRVEGVSHQALTGDQGWIEAGGQRRVGALAALLVAETRTDSLLDSLDGSCRVEVGAKQSLTVLDGMNPVGSTMSSDPVRQQPVHFLESLLVLRQKTGVEEVFVGPGDELIEHRLSIRSECEPFAEVDLNALRVHVRSEAGAREETSQENAGDRVGRLDHASFDSEAVVDRS